MKFFDLTQQTNKIREELDAAYDRVIKSGMYVNGPEVEGFEKELAKYCGAKYAVSCNSGTDALLLSLKSIGLKPGDEVITTAFTFVATASTIILAGGTPVFVDIDPNTLNIDPDLIGKAVTKKTKAIVPVHLFGRMCQMDKINKIAKKHKLTVIEDCAQAIGSLYKGKKAGVWGQAGCFSFFPTKNLGAFGDAGAMVTNDKKLYEAFKALRSHGSSRKDKYLHLAIGINSRLDALSAAFLSVKLKYLDQYNNQRRTIAKYYNQKLRGQGDIITPEFESHEHSFHQYTIRTKKRNQLAVFLKAEDIPTMIYYPRPLHLQPVFKSLGYKKGDLPHAEQACKEVISLPIYPELSLREQGEITDKLTNFK